MTMSKNDLITAIANATGEPNATVKTVLDNALDVITTRTQGGEVISLPGFGRFTMKERAARMGRNPSTGETIEIAASRRLTFKASKSRT